MSVPFLICKFVHTQTVFWRAECVLLSKGLDVPAFKISQWYPAVACFMRDFKSSRIYLSFLPSTWQPGPPFSHKCIRQDASPPDSPVAASCVTRESPLVVAYVQPRSRATFKSLSLLSRKTVLRHIS